MMNEMFYFIKTLPRSFANAFLGKKIYLHLVAIALTAIIVLSGADWRYFLATRGSTLQSIAFSAVALGGILPIVIPLCLLAWGYASRNRARITMAWALGQAALLGLIISSIYKFFTGRMPPPHANPLLLVPPPDTSGAFQFGFGQGGIFWGWPSSHTTVAFAMAFALIYLIPRSKWRWLALIYAFFIGLGVSVTIHWFSEFVAGALIGTAVGLAVGKTYLEKLRKS